MLDLLHRRRSLRCGLLASYALAVSGLLACGDSRSVIVEESAIQVTDIERLPTGRVAIVFQPGQGADLTGITFSQGKESVRVELRGRTERLEGLGVSDVGITRCLTVSLPGKVSSNRFTFSRQGNLSEFERGFKAKPMWREGLCTRADPELISVRR